MKKRMTSGKVFLFSMLLSMTVLGTLLFLSVAWIKESKKTDVPQADIVYTHQPTKKENLAALLLLCNDLSQSPAIYELVLYHAPTGRLYTTVLPKEIVGTVNGYRGNLTAQYEYTSTQGVVSGVENTLGIAIDCYFRVTKTGAANLADTIGGVVLEDISIPTVSDNHIPVRVDGQTFSELLFQSRENIEIQNQLLYAYMTQASCGQTDIDEFWKSVFYNCETDFNQYDLALRQTGFEQLLQTTEHTTALPLEGTMRDGVFQPSLESVDVLRKNYVPQRAN